jgi:organic radical activating enzyme
VGSTEEARAWSYRIGQKAEGPQSEAMALSRTEADDIPHAVTGRKNMIFEDIIGTTRKNLARLRSEARRLRYEIPGTPYRSLRDEDRRAFKEVLDVWRPENRSPVILLRWFMTEWCNYNCPYCDQTHGRREAKGGRFTAHAFDNFPLEQWEAAFQRHFEDKHLSIVLTGGEPFVDRKSLTSLLNTLSGMRGTECIRIDTNAWWRPDQYRDLDKSKITLMCTFHPSQIDGERFLKKIDEILDAGFKIGMVNYVMNVDNLPRYLIYKEAFRQRGIPLHPNPLWGADEKYSKADLELLKTELTEVDFIYRSGVESPRDKKCLFPSLGYEMDYRGTIYVGCHRATSRSFFDPRLPELFAGPVPCPHKSCVCLDKYSFLDGINRNIETDPLKVYGDVLRRKYKIANTPVSA